MKQNKYSILFLLVISFYSCKKFIEIDPPSNELVATNIYYDNSTATAAVTVIYSQMENDALPYYLSLFGSLSADEMKSYSNQQNLSEIYTNAITASNSLIGSNVWTSLYKYIYEANANLEGLQSAQNLTPLVRTQLIGESKFIRAFWYFHLVNLFGDVPLILTTDYKKSSTAERTPQGLVYDQIVNDLKDATELLNSEFLNADGITTSEDRVRPTKWAANALLARVYLYLEKYENAEASATAVINHSASFSLCEDLSKVFLKNSNEAIWQLMIPQPSGFNTVEGQYFILTSIPQDNIFNCATLSVDLLDSFEVLDKRRMIWTNSFNDGNQDYSYPYKYKVKSSSDISEYSMVLRLAEQILIRAEARIQQGDIEGGMLDINSIRVRAGLPEKSFSDPEEAVNAVMHERQTEMFCEWGHRWLDLKRTNRVDDVMNINAIHKGGSWQASSKLYPIPQAEITINPNLRQNDGY